MEDIYCFAGNPLDRASERRRDTEWVASLLDDPAARILPLRDLRPLTRDGTARRRSTGRSWRRGARLIERGATLIFLGLGDDGAAFRGRCERRRYRPRGGDSEAFDARTLAPLLPGGEAAILAEARSLIDWHARHRFCAQCGSPTRVESAGWVRRCPECRASHFPRTDPVVDHAGGARRVRAARAQPAARRQPLFVPRRFMEPGETLEEAVRRETIEEAGIRVGSVRYLACQPWPFPSSLMTGFLCEALTEEITVDPEELAEARWFSRDEIRAMVARAATGPDDPTQLSLPGPVAIAHHLCRRWSHGLDDI